MIIDGQNLAMYNGDDESFTVSLEEADGTDIDLVAGDTITFTVRTTIDAVATTIQKVVTSFTDGDAVVTIDAADTTSLAIGEYVYDVQVTYASGNVSTIVPPSAFTILKGVT